MSNPNDEGTPHRPPEKPKPGEKPMSTSETGTTGEDNPPAPRDDDEDND
jgi:hypothetical protein